MNEEDRGNKRRTGHLVISNRIGQDLSEVEEDATALIKDLDARLDLEVFAYGVVERMESRLAVPEEVGRVEHIGRYVPCN